MRFITAEQLYDRLKTKNPLSLPVLIETIEEEFEVSIHVGESPASGDLDVNALSNDPDVIRQIRASRQDREAGKTWSGEGGLEFLRQQIQEFDRESNL